MSSAWKDCPPSLEQAVVDRQNKHNIKALLFGFYSEVQEVSAPWPDMATTKIRTNIFHTVKSAEHN